MLRIGMLGCGNMAAKMADALAGHDDIVIAGVAARERSKAKSFAAKHCPDAKVYTTYAKLAAADDIDLIYIATPNTYHYEHAIMCIKEYKNILVEKPFTMSKAEADSIFFEAKNRNLFVAEAMWTSFMPLHAQMMEWVDEGRIGQVKYISANLGYDITDVPRLNDPVLGGGAYLDLGCYTTNLALSLMGDDIKVSRVFARKYSTGIDKDTTYCLETDDGTSLAVLYVTMTANTDKVGQLKNSRPIVRWAFEAKEGKVSDVFECGQQFIVAALTEVNEGEYRSLESVRPELVYEATNNAKAAYIKKQLKDVESLEKAAEVLGQPIQHIERVSLADSRFGNAGMEPAVIGKALAIGENALSEPIQGNTGVFMIRTNAANNAADAFNAETEKAQLSARFAYLPYQAMQLIEEKAEVTDNRANFQ